MRSALLPVASASKRSDYFDPLKPFAGTEAASGEAFSRSDAPKTPFLCRMTNDVEFSFHALR